MFAYTTDPHAIPARKIITLDGIVRYECPDECWTEHFKQWQKLARKKINAPEPMPLGHLMFDDPVGYGCLPFGCDDDETKRQAWESRIRSDLVGWDRGIPKEIFDRIVNQMVELRLQGVDTGSWPYQACVGALVSCG